MQDTSLNTVTSASILSHQELVALQSARNEACDAWVAAKNAAEKEWTRARGEIRKKNPEPTPDGVRDAQRRLKDVETEVRDLIKQAERERDTAIQQARAACEKKKSKHRARARAAAGALREAQQERERDLREHEKEVREQYAYERPAYFGDAMELHDAYMELRDQFQAATANLSVEERRRVYEEADA